MSWCLGMSYGLLVTVVRLWCKVFKELSVPTRGGGVSKLWQTCTSKIRDDRHYDADTCDVKWLVACAEKVKPSAIFPRWFGQRECPAVYLLGSQELVWQCLAALGSLDVASFN